MVLKVYQQFHCSSHGRCILSAQDQAPRTSENGSPTFASSSCEAGLYGIPGSRLASIRARNTLVRSKQFVRPPEAVKFVLDATAFVEFKGKRGNTTIAFGSLGRFYF